MTTATEKVLAHDAARDTWTQQDQMLLDWLTTAVEGGIGYWCQTTEYKWIVTDPADAHATVVETEPDDGEATPIRVGLPELRMAMNLIAGIPSQVGVRPTHPLVKRLWNLRFDLDAGERWMDLDASSEFDAIDADMLFQVAALGRVIYG